MRKCVDPAELADGDLRCRGWPCIEKLRMEDGREEYSPRSELGVWLPNERRVGICGESSTSICVDVTDDRLELTLLDRREEADGRWRWPPVREPNLPPDELLPRRLVVVPVVYGGRYVLIPGGPTASFRLPLRSSLNQSRNVVRRFARLRCCGAPPVAGLVEMLGADADCWMSPPPALGARAGVGDVVDMRVFP